MSEECRIESISAVTYYAADMRLALGFYRALGFELVYGDDTAAFCSLKGGAGFVNLIHGPPPAAPWGRVIIYVSDVDAMYRRVLAAGFSPEFAPSDARWGERYFHVRDPDGNELSFARPLTP